MQIIYVFVREDIHIYVFKRASLVAQMVKIPPAMQESWVRSLSWEDPREEGNTHSVFLQATVHGISKSRTQLSK